MIFVQGSASKVRKVGQSVQELAFGLAFEKYLLQNQNRKGIARFSYLLKETQAAVGIADIVTIKAAKLKKTEVRFLEALERLPILGSSFVLAELENHKRISKKTILARSPFSKRFTQSVLLEMARIGMIDEDKRGYVHLHQRFKLPMTEITFFELKITDWRRAYFQAAQAQSYADRTYCVFPINKRRLLLENKNTFLRAGVGVIVFDVEASSAEEIIRAKVASPKRLSNKIYMIFQLSKFVSGRPQRKSMTQTKQKNTLFSRLISILNRNIFR
jgi:hypothetical protein